MRYFIKKNIDLLRVGQIFFNFGIILLISAPFLGGLFLILSIIISFIKEGSTLLKNKWNYPVFLCLGLVMISKIKNTIFSTQNFLDNNEIWLGLFNWVPILLIFVGATPYISNNFKRIQFSKLIIISNFPLIFSCFLQKQLEIYGPFSTLNGLIIWFQRAPGITTSSTTGLFNNPNYTGFSLILIIPFLLHNILNEKNNNLKKLIFIFILSLTIYYALLTQSRNAFLGIIISFSISFGIKFILILLAILLMTYPLNIMFGAKIEIDYILFLIKKNILEYQRLEIWQNSIEFIIQRPLLGWGAATFGALYLLNEGLYKSLHTHNIILQIAQSYGLPCAILISSTISFLLIKSIKLVFNKKKQINSVNRFWVISLISVCTHQLFDIVLYEGRLNIVFCLILAGTKSILEEDIRNQKTSQNLST